jgi:hypothetical protein
MRLIKANQMSPNLIFNCAVRLDPGFAIGESSAGPSRPPRKRERCGQVAGAVAGPRGNLRLLDTQMFN